MSRNGPGSPLLPMVMICPHIASGWLLTLGVLSVDTHLWLENVKDRDGGYGCNTARVARCYSFLNKYTKMLYLILKLTGNQRRDLSFK